MSHDASALLAATKSSPTQSVVVIAACASVGGLILLLIVARIVYRVCNRERFRPAPLPPVQPLAHYREQRLHASIDPTVRQSFYNTALYASAPSMGPGASRTSLLAHSQIKASPSHHSISTETTEDTNTLSSSSHYQHKLLTPQPPFSTASPSTCTLESDEASTPRSTSSNGLSYDGSSNYSPSRRTPSLSNPRRLNSGLRPVSMASFGSSVSRNSLRGVPHSRHSQIQIVLPAPLSANMHRHSTRSVSMGRSNSRISVADTWTTPASITAADSSDSLGDPHPPTASLHRISRSESGASASASLRSQSVDSCMTATPHELPPVPPIPSMFTSGSLSGSLTRAPPAEPNTTAKPHELPPTPIPSVDTSESLNGSLTRVPLAEPNTTATHYELPPVPPIPSMYTSESLSGSFTRITRSAETE